MSELLARRNRSVSDTSSPEASDEVPSEMAGSLISAECADSDGAGSKLASFDIKRDGLVFKIAERSRF
jgi:hypothetical protein